MIIYKNDLCFNDILLVPNYSTLESRTIPSLGTKLGWLRLSTPLISAPMDSVTGTHMLLTMDSLGGLGILTRHINLSDTQELAIQVKDIKYAKEQGALNVGCAIGIKHNVDTKARSLLDVGCNVICLDVAHGDHLKMYNAIKALSSLKNRYPFVLIAGNVCTSEAAIRFALEGVDAIKVGIGPGAACTTRLTTGFGRGQLSVIEDTSHAVRNMKNVSIIADGGIRTSGDMVKSIWAGADSCMIGYMLAGTSDTPTINGKRLYRGMSSNAASGRQDIAPEGVEIEMKDCGKTEKVVKEYIKGIRSGLAMGGANNIHELRKNVECVVVSPLSMQETLTKE